MYLQKPLRCAVTRGNVPSETFTVRLVNTQISFFFFIWVLRPFQEYFTYIERIVHQRWAKTGEPREKPPDHP